MSLMMEALCVCVEGNFKENRWLQDHSMQLLENYQAVRESRGCLIPVLHFRDREIDAQRSSGALLEYDITYFLFFQNMKMFSPKIKTLFVAYILVDKPRSIVQN